MGPRSGQPPSLWEAFEAFHESEGVNSTGTLANPVPVVLSAIAATVWMRGLKKEAVHCIGSGSPAARWETADLAR